MMDSCDQLDNRQRADLLRYDGLKLPPPSEADPQLAAVILKACAYRKEERYAGAQALRADLKACLQRKACARTRRSRGKRIGMLAGACVLTAALTAGAVYAAKSGRLFAPAPMPTSSPTPTASPTTTVSSVQAESVYDGAYVRLTEDGVILYGEPGELDGLQESIPADTLLLMTGMEQKDGDV